MKLIFVIPIFNDWNCLKELTARIKEVSLKQKWEKIEFIIINDGSTQELQDSENTFGIEGTILNLLSNQSNQRAIAIGLAYLSEKLNDFDYVIIMDADGEDKAADITNLVNEAEKNNSKKLVFAHRAKRNQGIFISIFYKIYKFLFKFLTGERLDFGNFSCIPKKFVKKVVSLPDISLHYSASIIKSKLPYTKVTCDKGKRFKDHSKMGKRGLFFHGLISLSLYMDVIIFKFFFASLFGIFLTLLGMGSVFYLKLFTHIPVVGWSSNTLMGLFIVFMILLLICFISLVILLNKKLYEVDQFKNIYKHFIENETSLK